MKEKQYVKKKGWGGERLRCGFIRKGKSASVKNFSEKKKVNEEPEGANH